MTQTVLITGANSGFGYLIANTLIENGYKVVGSMRDPQGRNASIANELKAKGMIVVDIDVTNDESVINGVAQEYKEAGSIDVLINNAGAGTLGWQESLILMTLKKFLISMFLVFNV